MASLHEPGISKARKITGYVLSILVSAMLFFGGIMKLIGDVEMQANMDNITNIGELMFKVGLIEMICPLYPGYVFNASFKEK